MSVTMRPAAAAKIKSFGSCLRACTILLGVLGLLICVSPQGLVALCSLCQVGCCCGGSRKVARAAASLKCKAYTICIFAVLSIVASAIFGEAFLKSVCGIAVTNAAHDPLKLGVWSAGVAALAAAAGVYQLAHPSTTVQHAIWPTNEADTPLNTWIYMVYPFEVCDLVPLGDISTGDGIYFPHPLHHFAAYINWYVIGINTLMIVLAAASIYCAAQIAKLQSMEALHAQPQEWVQELTMVGD